MKWLLLLMIISLVIFEIVSIFGRKSLLIMYNTKITNQWTASIRNAKDDIVDGHEIVRSPSCFFGGRRGGRNNLIIIINGSG